MDNDNFLPKIATLLENVKSNISIINNLKEHFKTLLSHNIIHIIKYSDIVDKLKFLNSESVKQSKILKLLEQITLIGELEDNSENYFNFNFNNRELIITKIKTVKNNSKTIFEELVKIIYDYGYLSISLFLNTTNKDLFEKYNNNINLKISSFEKFFQIIKVDKKNIDFKDDVCLKINNISPEPIKKLQKLAIMDKLDIEIVDDDKLKINLIYELNKACIQIEIADTIYIFDGYFKEDTFNEIYQEEMFEKKYNNIQQQILVNNSDTKFKSFFKEYMGQLSIKDFIVCDEEQILDKIKKMYSFSNKINRMSLIDILNDFVEKDLYQKRDVIIVLLLDENNLESIIDDLYDKELFENIVMPGEDDTNIKKIDIENQIKKSDSNSKDNIPNISNIPNIPNIPENINSNDDSDEFKNKKNNKKTKIDDKFKNPLPLVKFNKATATRYSINSIMRNFDTTNEYKNLKSILSNSKKILNANILMDFLRNSILKFAEYDNFINSIHWNYRKKIFARSISDSKSKSTEEVTWETKISLLDITNKSKEKVNEKIKEVRSSRDNSKAESFVESFFRIPFGKYIKEDIFVRSANSDIKMKRLVDLINSYITNPDDKIFVSDSLEKLKQKTITSRLIHDIENFYWDFLEEKNNINKEKQNYMEKVDKILEDAIYGHKESKREIKRLIAQWMGGKMEGAVIGFHGPPGVGKTCFAKKGVSKCLFDSEGNPRPFCILQLGGATDGSILEGHSYTYVGAKPGRLVEFLQETKCMNPIIYFDELDKVSETEKGKEIIDVLIHLTDKSQNKEIFDKYFSGIELDFSKAIIIFSYNDASKVNRILRDRITEIKINPLTKADKVVITKKYTLPEITDELNYNCILSDELVEYIIDTYTLEPGVRKLNEKLYEIFREINLRILENPNININLNQELIDEILTRHYKVKPYKIHSKPEVGLVNGLYASTIGLGGITLIQLKKILTASTNIPLELTGKQGDVMKESMSCAKTLALNLLTSEEKQSLQTELKSNPFGLHIHCPDGATPKDGPSAGITITTGIYSLLTNKPIRNDIAMTGEVDLQGNVKAIGGLDAKINGAIKAGVKLVIFPKENEQDWEKILKEKALNGDIEIYMAETIDQVIQKAIIL